MAAPLHFADGDTLQIRADEAEPRLWSVVGRKRGGYNLRPLGLGDARFWQDQEILDLYSRQRITHYPFDVSGLPQKYAETLDRTWDVWPAGVRRTAERRLLYVEAVDEIRGHSSSLHEAYATAAQQVFNAHRSEWELEDTATLAEQDLRRRPKGTEPENLLKAVLACPSPYTVRTWYIPWSHHGRDLRILLPHHHRKGNRIPRAPHSTDGGPDPYNLMDDVIERAYMSMPRKCKKLSYRIYVSACDTHSVIPLSSTTFCKRIRKNYTDREEYALRYGARAAYLKFGVFDQTKLPERPLQEVEVDHCLIDLIVVHPDSRKPIGRPWLTALLDRATRVVLGMHLSFEAPSYACLQRALAHAIWPKNLHGVEGLKDDWPCHGVPEFLICDNGKEFRSRSLRASEGLLRFKVVNLPFKSPWLKGSLERLFGTIGVQVFSWQQGATLSRTPEFYDPVRRAERTLAEVRELLLRWVVNDYHRERHPRLRCSPIERWRQLTELFPVRPVPDFDHIVRLTGAIVDRQISNVGVPHEGLLYSDKAVLERLLARRGGIQKNWLIRVDPYDLGEAWILDDEQGDWHCLPCTNQAISRGVSRFQHKLHQVTARRNLPRGQPVREQDLARAREACEAAVASLHSAGAKTGAMARAARYATGGDYFTGMPGALATRTATVDPRPLMVASDEVAAGTEIAPPDLTAEVSLLAATWVEAAR